MLTWTPFACTAEPGVEESTVSVSSLTWTMVVELWTSFEVEVESGTETIWSMVLLRDLSRLTLTSTKAKSQGRATSREGFVSCEHGKCPRTGEVKGEYNTTRQRCLFLL